MSQCQPDLRRNWQRASENREYVRRLLAEKQPGFAAVLRSAERQLDLELSLSSRVCRQDPCCPGRMPACVQGYGAPVDEPETRASVDDLSGRCRCRGVGH